MRAVQIQEEHLKDLQRILDTLDVGAKDMGKIFRGIQQDLNYYGFTIFENQEVIGFCSIRILEVTGKTTIWLAQDKQGEGRGTAVMRWMIKFARRKKLSKLILRVRKDNITALKLYHNLGFKELEEDERSKSLSLRL
jgi:RimJ/RimL family protein N-acetyltransferase